MSDLIEQWDALKDAIPSDHAEAASLMWDHGDRMADRITALEAQIAAADGLADMAGDAVNVLLRGFYDEHEMGKKLRAALATYHAARVQP